MKFKVILLALMLICFQFLYAEEWIVKIDQEAVTANTFNRIYYAYARYKLNLNSNEAVDILAAKPEYEKSPINKNVFLEQFIIKKLLYKKAMNDISVNRNELDVIVENAKLYNVSQYYLDKKLRSKITVTDEEIKDYYNQELSKEEIRKQIRQAKTHIKEMEFISELQSKSSNKDKIVSDDEVDIIYYCEIRIKENLATNEEVDRLAASPGYREHPLYSKSFYRDRLTSQKLLYNCAVNDSEIDKDIMELTTDLMKLHTVSQYYLILKIRNKLTVTDSEINEIYDQYKNELSPASKEEAAAFIRKQLLDFKYHKETEKYIKALLSESKIERPGTK